MLPLHLNGSALMNERKDALDTELLNNRIKASQQREGIRCGTLSFCPKTDERLDTPGVCSAVGSTTAVEMHPNESPYNGEGKQDGKETGTTRSMAERPTRAKPVSKDDFINKY